MTRQLYTVRDVQRLATGPRSGVSGQKPLIQVSSDVLARMTGLPIERLTWGHVAGSDGAAEIAATRALAVALRDARFRAGVGTLNPDVLPILVQTIERARDASALNSRTRRKATTAALYLQRLTTKCEMNGEFGPIAWGSFDSDLHDAVRIRARASRFGIGRRFCSVPYWLIDEVIARLIHPKLRTSTRSARLHPMCEPDGFSLRLVDPTNLELQGQIEVPDKRMIRALLELDGRWPIHDIGRRHNVDLSVFDELVGVLVECGWVFLQPEVPYGVVDPLAWLRRWIVENRALLVADEAESLLGELHELRLVYAGGDVEARRSALRQASARVTGDLRVPSSRGAGEFYADRYVFFEDTSRSWEEFSLGEPVVSVIHEDLAPVARAYMTVPTVKWRCLRAALADWFTSCFGTGLVSLPQFCAAAATRKRDLQEIFEHSDREASRVATNLVQVLLPPGATDSEEVAVDREVLGAFLDEHRPASTTLNLDVMLARLDPPKLVLSELHAMQNLLVTGPAAHLHPTPRELVRETVAGYELIHDEELAVPVTGNFHKAYSSLDLPFPEVELVGRSARSGPDRIAARDLFVGVAEQSLSLVTSDGRRLFLTRPASRARLFNAFAPPTASRIDADVFLGNLPRQVPRVVLGDLVILRRTWTVDAHELQPDLDLPAFDASLRDWAAQRQIPRWMFIRLASERKPVYLDLDSIFLKDWLRRKLRSEGGQFQVTEMYPGPGDLWLKDADGHYCVEFRFVVSLRG